MPYRFVLDMPEELHDSAKAAVSTAHDAMVLIERRPNPTSPDGSRTELSVSAHSLDVIDVVYAWLGQMDAAGDVYLEAYKGGRFPLVEHDPKELRRLIQGNQYWYEKTMPHIHYLETGMMEGGAKVAEVPFGGRSASGSTVALADHEVKLGALDHIAVRVRDPYRAEMFYRDFFGMNVSYRARRDGDRWEMLAADYDWDERFTTGLAPDIIRLENGPTALVIINAGAASVLMEARVAYVSVNAPVETLNALRGRALFASYTVEEDSPRSFRFIDPFGISWQIVAA